LRLGRDEVKKEKWRDGGMVWRSDGEKERGAMEYCNYRRKR